MRERLIVVGNGMVGLRFVEELLARAPDRYDITVVGKEPPAGLQPRAAVVAAGGRSRGRRVRSA